MKNIILKFLVLLLVPFISYASDESASGDEGTNFGASKAVTAFSKDEGFKLSDKAVQNLGIEFQNVRGAGQWKISSDAVVHLKQSSGVYRKVDGWILFVLIKVLKKSGSEVLIQSEDLQDGDEVAVKGVTFLRMTDADLNAGTVDSCAH
jgi:hypothetical protein